MIGALECFTPQTRTLPIKDVGDWTKQQPLPMEAGTAPVRTKRRKRRERRRR